MFMCYYYLICFPSIQCHVFDTHYGNTYIYTRITKTFSIKMTEDVGMSKPKKHAIKVGKLTYM